MGEGPIPRGETQSRKRGSSVECRQLRTPPNRRHGRQNECDSCNECDSEKCCDCEGTDSACPRWHVSIVEWRLHYGGDFLPRDAGRSRSRRTRAKVGGGACQPDWSLPARTLPS